MSFNLDKLIRPNIKVLKPYSSAQDEYAGRDNILLNANENSIGSPLQREANFLKYNRYPDAYQKKVKEAIGHIKSVNPKNIFLGNGSDECIDLLYRCFCEPDKDNVIICPPTYGMYEVSANINNVEVRKAPLLENFQLDLIHLETLINENTKIIWLCSPNNPTGNSLNREDMEMVLNNFNGLVAVDEAYINFARQKSFIQELSDYPNLVVLQTFSKAWGMAGLRLGIAMAPEEIVSVLNKVKPPYNINAATQQLALQALNEMTWVNDTTLHLADMRNALAEVLERLPIVEKVFPSDANFLLVKIKDARKVYEFLLSKGIVVRDRSKEVNCENCLRITIGTEKENTDLIEALNGYRF